MVNRMIRAAIFALTLAATPALAATQYLDNNIGGAADTNNCTASNTPCATLAGVLTTQGSHTALAAGDVLMIGSHHSESLSAGTTYTFPGTNANLNLIFDANDSAWAAGAHTVVSADLVNPNSASSALIANSANTTLKGSFEMRGMRFSNSANTAGTLELALNGSYTQKYTQCKFSLTNAGTSATMMWGGTSGNGATKLTLDGSQVSFGNASQTIILAGIGFGEVRNNTLGTFIASGSTIPTALFTPETGTGTPSYLELTGVDLTNHTGAVAKAGQGDARIVVKHSGTNASMMLSNGTLGGPGAPSVRLENSDSAATYYALHWTDYQGQIDTDTANYQNGGSTYNGTNGISYKMTGGVSAAGAAPLVSPILQTFHLNSGVSETITVQFMFDGASNSQGFNATQLTNAQFWARLAYQGSSGSPLATFTSDQVADLLPSTSTANQSTSTATWTSPSVTTVEPGKLTFTITPQIAGWYALWVEAAIPTGKIIWVDMQPAVSP